MRPPSPPARIRHACVWAAALALGLVPLRAQDAPDDPAQAPTTTVRQVAVFKNGFGFFVREGDARVEKGVGRIDPVPKACLGTLGLYSRADGARITSVTASRRPTNRTVPCRTLDDLLAANGGMEVVLQAGDKSYAGTLLPAAEEADEAGAESGPPPPTAVTSIPPAAQNPAARGAVVLIQTAEGTQAVERGLVTGVVFRKAARRTRTLRETRPVLDLGVEGAAGPAIPVGMRYLERGIRWIPEYTLALDETGEAVLTLHATLINDVEDLHDVELLLSPGALNFPDEAALSPLTLQGVMTGLSQYFLPRAVAPPPGSPQTIVRYVSGTGQTDAVPSSNPIDPDEFKDRVDLPVDAAGKPVVYRIPRFSLRAGERTQVALFTQKVKTRPLYRLDLVDPYMKFHGEYWQLTMNYRGWQPSQWPPEIRQKMEALKKTDSVWRFLSIANATEWTWSSGPAFVVQGLRPLGRETLPFTAPGEEALLPLSPAGDIAVTKREEEVHRQQNANHSGGYPSDLVDISAVVTVTSRRTDAVAVQIKRCILGEVGELSPGAKSAPGNPDDADDLNGATEVTWDITLEPGETKKVEYKYSTYLRRNY